MNDFEWQMFLAGHFAPGEDSTLAEAAITGSDEFDALISGNYRATEIRNATMAMTAIAFASRDFQGLTDATVSDVTAYVEGQANG